MKQYIKWKVLKEKEVKMTFNMGLQSAVYILEKAERLSPKGRKHLLESLKKNIAKSEGSSKLHLMEGVSGNFK